MRTFKDGVVVTEEGSMHSIRLILSMVTYLAFSVTALAVDSYWIGGNGAYTNSINWSVGVPQTGDRVYFTNSATYAVSLSPASCSDVRFEANAANVVLSMTNGDLWSCTNVTYVGDNRPSNTVTVTGSGVIYSANNSYIGANSAASNNTLTVSGSSITWSNASLFVGNAGFQSRLMVKSGATVVTTNLGSIANNLGAEQSQVVVSDSNSIWRIVAPDANNGFFVGNNGGYGSVVVSNGGKIVSGMSYLGKNGAGATNNYVLVTGRDSVWSNSYLAVGNNTSGNLLVVSNGAAVMSANNIDLGVSRAVGSNAVVVTGGNAYFGTGSAGTLHFYGGTANSLTVTNGARVFAYTFYLGQNINTAWGANTNCTTLVTDGGVLQVGAQLRCGTAGTSQSISNTVLFTRGGRYVGAYLRCAAGGNVISNAGGIFQFTQVNPTITLGDANSIAINGGTISLLNVNNADVRRNWSGTDLARITYGGANTFQLDNSTNGASGVDQTYSYAVIPGAATNYAGLELVNGNTAYTNGSVTIASSGWLTFSNTAAIMWRAVTNNGTMRLVDNSSVAFKGDLKLGEGCTNTWTTNSTSVVNGTLTLPTNAVIMVNGITSLPAPAVIFDATGGTMAGATDLKGWTITGPGVNPYTHAIIVGKQVKLVTSKGVILSFF